MPDKKYCPLCGSGEISSLRGNMSRCGCCSLAFRPWRSLPPVRYSPEAEKDIYETSKLVLFRQRLNELNRLFPDRGRLLDIGSAYGGFLKMARADGWSAEGVEIDPEMIAASSAAGFKVHSGQLEGLGLRHGSYTAITCSEALCLMPDPAAALKEINRLLRPCGVLYLREFNADFHLALYGNRLLKKLGLQPAIVHDSNFTPGGLRFILEKNGFRVLRLINSRPTSGDPYRTGGRLGLAFTVMAKMLCYALAGLLYFLSSGRILAGPSFIIYAEKGGGG